MIFTRREEWGVFWGKIRDLPYFLLRLREAILECFPLKTKTKGERNEICEYCFGSAAEFDGGLRLDYGRKEDR
jgi:hypothetical protein